MMPAPHLTARYQQGSPLASSDFYKGVGSALAGIPMDIVNLLKDLQKTGSKVEQGEKWLPSFLAAQEENPYAKRFGTTEYIQELLGGDSESSESLAGYLSSMLVNPTTALAGIPFLTNIIRTADKGEGLASLLNKESLFHGSPIKKLKTLSVPKGEGTEHLSQGGVYLTRGKGDPRLIQFGGIPAGSIYEAKPSFTRTLDPRQLPADERKILSEGFGGLDPDVPSGEGFMSHFKKVGNKHVAKESDWDRRVRELKNLKRDMPQIRTLLKDKYDLREPHYPARVSKKFSDEIQKLGYDSLMYPKLIVKNPKTPNYRETIISLDPENTLELIDETNVGDFLQIMLRNADRSKF